MSFGKWLVQARERAGLTQRELAQRAGISTTYVSGLEREEPSARDGSPRRPRVEKIDALARALGIQRDEARLAAGYAPAKPFTKPATIEELADALNALGLPVPQAPFPLDPDGEGFREMIERMYLDMQLVIDRMRRGRG